MTYNSLNKITSSDKNFHQKLCNIHKTRLFLAIKALGLTTMLLLSPMTAKPATANPIRPVIECAKSKPCVTTLKKTFQRGIEISIEQALNIYDAITKLPATNNKSKLLDQLDKLEKDIETKGKMTPEIKIALAQLRTKLENN